MSTFRFDLGVPEQRQLALMWHYLGEEEFRAALEICSHDRVEIHAIYDIDKFYSHIAATVRHQHQFEVCGFVHIFPFETYCTAPGCPEDGACRYCLAALMSVLLEQADLSPWELLQRTPITAPTEPAPPEELEVPSILSFDDDPLYDTLDKMTASQLRMLIISGCREIPAFKEYCRSESFRLVATDEEIAEMLQPRIKNPNADLLKLLEHYLKHGRVTALVTPSQRVVGQLVRTRRDPKLLKRAIALYVRVCIETGTAPRDIAEWLLRLQLAVGGSAELSVTDFRTVLDADAIDFYRKRLSKAIAKKTSGTHRFIDELNRLSLAEGDINPTIETAMRRQDYRRALQVLDDAGCCERANTLFLSLMSQGEPLTSFGYPAIPPFETFMRFRRAGEDKECASYFSHRFHSEFKSCDYWLYRAVAGDRKDFDAEIASALASAGRIAMRVGLVRSVDSGDIPAIMATFARWRAKTQDFSIEAIRREPTMRAVFSYLAVASPLDALKLIFPSVWRWAELDSPLGRNRAVGCVNQAYEIADLHQGEQQQVIRQAIEQEVDLILWTYAQNKKLQAHFEACLPPRGETTNN